MEIEQAKAVTATEMQTRLTAQGLYPPTQDALDEIWANPVAKALWLESPLDDPNVIWEKVGLESEIKTEIKTEVEVEAEVEVTPQKWADVGISENFDEDFAQWANLESGSRTGSQEKLMQGLGKQLIDRMEEMSEEEQIALINTYSKEQLKRLERLARIGMSAPGVEKETSARARLIIKLSRAR
jgi:hypothetical protein